MVSLLHSGEFSHSATDLTVKGRGIDFAFTRTYRNQTTGAGPLGLLQPFADVIKLLIKEVIVFQASMSVFTKSMDTVPPFGVHWLLDC